MWERRILHRSWVGILNKQDSQWFDRFFQDPVKCIAFFKSLAGIFPAACGVEYVREQVSPQES